MSPDSASRNAKQEAPTLRADDSVGTAVRTVLDSGLPAVPVVDEEDKLVGIFGEREFMGAVFPGYLKELSYAKFVKSTLDAALEKRAGAREEPVSEYMTTDHVDVAPDHSDAEVAEIFLHHRVLIVPVVDEGKVIDVITRADFFRNLGERFLQGG